MKQHQPMAAKFITLQGNQSVDFDPFIGRRVAQKMFVVGANYPPE